MLRGLFATIVLTLISALAAAAQTPSPADQITEVTLERTACFGSCPAYKVTLRRDGTIIYEGKRFVQMMGTYQGQAYGFDRLAEFILSQDYFNLKDNYSVPVTDLPSTITSVVRDGKRKTITDYGNIEPVGLWGIEMSIDGILKNARLEKVAVPSVRPRR